eukprot:TRINITY_DN2948_c0_g1_i1.p2 TRINITY_DN2948_c0_g1~~TRINITY_DN2948_c0_g1_i1.p2  ORF type:complete len:262 (+),score=62.09 TRINITY_DN2948_c0_g1_i1:54-839(+)
MEGPPGQTMGVPLLAGTSQPAPDMRILAQSGELYVRQSLDFIEAFCPICEIRNHYGIYSNEQAKQSMQFFMAAHEDSECCCRIFCNPRHTLRVNVGMPLVGVGGAKVPPLDIPIMSVDRPFTWCCSTATVNDAAGRPIATLDEECISLISVCPVQTTVKTPQDEPMFTVTGPSLCWMVWCMPWPCRDPFVFTFTRPSGEVAGEVQNIPTGCCRMMCSNADDYLVKFTEQLAPHERAVLLGTVFYLDYLYFQAKTQQNGQQQ